MSSAFTNLISVFANTEPGKRNRYSDCIVVMTAEDSCFDS
jgi:hypothetical protein